MLLQFYNPDYVSISIHNEHNEETLVKSNKPVAYPFWIPLDVFWAEKSLLKSTISKQKVRRKAFKMNLPDHNVIL